MSIKEEIICSCLDLTKNELLDTIERKGIKNLAEIGHETRAGLLCGICIEELKEILNGNK